jgi:hypothetical protein
MLGNGVLFVCLGLVGVEGEAVGEGEGGGLPWCVEEGVDAFVCWVSGFGDTL